MIKIFQMNECDWVAAESAKDAADWYATRYHCYPTVAACIADGMLDSARELSDEEMDLFKHLGLDGERSKWPKERVPTFRQELADDIAQGIKFPCLFGSTEY